MKRNSSWCWVNDEDVCVKKKEHGAKKKKYKNKSCENFSYCASLAIIIRPWFLLTESHLALHFQRLARL